MKYLSVITITHNFGATIFLPLKLYSQYFTNLHNDIDIDTDQQTQMPITIHNYHYH